MPKKKKSNGITQLEENAGTNLKNTRFRMFQFYN